MNKQFLSVVLGEEPRVKKIGSDKQVVNFVAFHKPAYAKDGDKDLRVFVEAWNGFGKTIQNNLTKGDKVIVIGEFKAPEDEKGQVYPTIRVTEPIEFIRVKKFNQPKASNVKTQASYQQQSNFQSNSGVMDGFQAIDDDTPNF